MSDDQIPTLPGKKRHQMPGVCPDGGGGGGDVEASIWMVYYPLVCSLQFAFYPQSAFYPPVCSLHFTLSLLFNPWSTVSLNYPLTKIFKLTLRNRHKLICAYSTRKITSRVHLDRIQWTQRINYSSHCHNWHRSETQICLSNLNYVKYSKKAMKFQ